MNEMLTKEELQYYDRQMLLEPIGVVGQEKLKQSKVLIIGAGGLGCPALRYLASAGVGTLGVVDFDQVSVSNLHRQILFDFDDVKKNKAEVAITKLKKVNPFIEYVAYPVRLSAENSIDIFEGFDVVVDCTDNYESRFLINDVCVLLNKPLVYGSIFKFEAQISVFNWQNGPTYRCLFKDFPSSESTADCNSSGVVGVLPGIVGLYQANEVIKMILGIGEVLSGKLMIFNSLNNQVTYFNLSKSQENLYDDLIKEKKLNPEKYIRPCTLSDSIYEFDYELIDLSNFQIIDVREPFELPVLESDMVVNVPLSELTELYSQINRHGNVLLLCKSGARSMKALDILRDQFGYSNVKSVRGGITDELISKLLEV
jgi:adenylyltransferase/sulfurtransferase